jgi:glucose-6-phosphate 1-epimerase
MLRHESAERSADAPIDSPLKLPEGIIQLVDGNAVAEVNRQGAYIDRFAIGTEEILFPTQLVQSKRRGTHLCLPNFGADVTGKLHQHGYAREVQWDVADEAASSSAIHLRYQPDRRKRYSGLLSDLKVSVADLSGESEAPTALLTLALSTTNTSEERLRVAPAVHPYFMLTDTIGADGVVIDNRAYPADVLGQAPTQPWPTDTRGFPEEVELEMMKSDSFDFERRLVLRVLGFEQMTVWTDLEGPYLCVEPSLAGASFTNDEGAPNEYLSPGRTAMYQLQIEAEVRH